MGLYDGPYAFSPDFPCYPLSSREALVVVGALAVPLGA